MGFDQPSSSLIPRAREFTRFVCALTVLIGAVVLVGWAFDIRSLQTVLPDLPAMKANTAMCLALSGISLWLLSLGEGAKISRVPAGRFAFAFSFLVMAVGTAVVCEYLLGWDLRIDQILFQDTVRDGNSIPGRMAPNTAVCFIFAGLALLAHRLETKRGHRPAQLLGLVPGFLALIAVMGYLYSVISFYQIRAFSGMALHTAIGLILLSMGIVVAPPDRGIGRILFADTSGGIVVRRLLPAVFVVPIALFWLGVEGQKAGLYDAEIGLALAVTLNIAVFTALVYINGIYIHANALARQETLRKSNENLKSTINALPLAVIVSDGPANVRIWNRAAERVFGWSEEEVIGHISPTIPEDKREELQSILNTIRQGKSITLMETVRKKKDGALVPVNLWAAPCLDETGASEGQVTVLEDVSERKRIESQLRQAQKMDAVGRLAGGVAHDFNNILGVIIGHCDLRLDSLDAESPLGKSVREIKRAAERAAGLTRQLLAFSRKQTVEHKVLNLNTIVIEMEKMLRRLIGENLDFVARLDPALQSVKADAGQIEQVIMNLAVNARDAMPDGGKLTIETANVEIDRNLEGPHGVMERGSYVMLACTDTGVGMDAQTQAKIFEPFFTTKGTGTGLGLATVYGIAKQSSGFVWVYSEPGKGTTMKVYLPRFEGAAEPESSPGRSVPKGGPETILVVEDEAPLRELVCGFLQGAGYNVLEAGDLREAREVSEAHSETIDLLLTDVVLPGGNGRTLAQELTGRRPGLKVLYVSGYPDEAIAHHGVLETGIAFLQKPYTRDALMRKVRNVLDVARQPQTA